jgi:hypothetical protein
LCDVVCSTAVLQGDFCELRGQSIAITREDFDDRKWQKKIRNAIQRRRSH